MSESLVFIKNFIKNRLQHRCFPVNISKFFRTAFLDEAPVVAAPDCSILIET